MDTIVRLPDRVELKDIQGQNLGTDGVSLTLHPDCLSVSVCAEGDLASLSLRWQMETKEPVRVLADAVERTYGKQEWASIRAEKPLPWFFFVLNETEKTVTGYGVRVRPHAFIQFFYDTQGITLTADLRNGTHELHLNGRTLPVCDIVCRTYSNEDLYGACDNFCAQMSPAPLLPSEPVYGGNNWYYAYGKSSFEQIVSDARFQARMAEGLSNRPFMVIDDGWEINKCCGPWQPNPDYTDMGKLAQAIRAQDVRPGLWVRYLNDEDPDFTQDMRLSNGKLDPSHPYVIHRICELNRTIVHDWGYELIKHDFSTVDITGNWGPQMSENILRGDITFYDKSLTTAEIILNFYQYILDSTDGLAYIIGCNTMPHLCAGLVHLNRTGDDTSGRSFNPTRIDGVNTLAFRLFTNRHFYMNDADCVGIMKGAPVDWRLTYQWAELLAYSGSPFFVSCADGTLRPEQEEQLKKLYAVASRQTDKTCPLDWLWNTTPDTWSVNGQIRRYNWYLDK